MYKNIKNERGITLSALVIYIFVFMLLLGVMTTISTFFYNGIREVVESPKYISEFNKFSMFFVTDVKNYSKATVTSNTIQFENGPTYQYQNGYIYRDGKAIAKNIMNCNFTASEFNVNSMTKNLINVNVQIGKNDEDSITKNVDFTLRYW